MIQEPRFKDNASRVIHRAEVDAVVSGWIALYTRAEALQAFTDAGVGARGRYRRVNGRSPRGRARHFDALPDAEHWRVTCHRHTISPVALVGFQGLML